MKSVLVLEDGTYFPGEGFGQKGETTLSRISSQAGVILLHKTTIMLWRRISVTISR